MTGTRDTAQRGGNAATVALWTGAGFRETGAPLYAAGNPARLTHIEFVPRPARPERTTR